MASSIPTGCPRPGAADEGGPAPVRRQPRRGPVRGQAPGEAGDEVLVAGRPARAEHEIAARARASSHPGERNPRRPAPPARPAADSHTTLRPRRMTSLPRSATARPAAAPRRCRTPPAPAPMLVSPGHARRPRPGQLCPLRCRVRRRRFAPGNASAAARRPIPDDGQTVERRPVSAPVEDAAPEGPPRRRPRSRHSPAGTPGRPGLPRASANRDTPRATVAAGRAAGCPGPPSCVPCPAARAMT